MVIEFLISWALGYGLSKGADRTFDEIRQLLLDDDLSIELRREAEEWSDQLPNDLGADLEARSVLGQMFQTERTPEGYGDAQQRLAATLREPAVPSTDEWFDALIERWDEVRHSLSAAEAHPFFTQRKELAKEQLRDLAERLHRVCEQSEEHFRNTISAAVQELEQKVDQLFDAPWATQEDYFSKWMNDEDLFRHSWALVGRDEVRGALRQFVLDEDKQVAILPGRGGVGKSKLLQAFCTELLETREAEEVRFVKESSEVKEAYSDSLPDGEPLIIILDDAHRRDRKELLALLQITQQRNAEGLNTKLILSTRPYRTDTIASTTLRNGFDICQIEKLEPLESLSLDDMRALARQALGAGYGGFADQLAAVGEDSPLVVTVGGLLVRREQVDPRLLPEESEEFRAAVLREFSDLFSRSISDRVEPHETEGMLQLVAALSPIRPEDNEFIEEAALFLQMTPSRVRTVLYELEGAGAFIRRGGLVRITPDVLSDDILHRVCRTPEGTTTSFARRVFDYFADRAAERILRNLAELDWRIRRTEGQSDLLDEIWETIRETYREGNVHQRIQLLSQLKEVAYYLPRRMLRLVEHSLAEPLDEDEEVFTGQLEDHLAKILQRNAYTVELLPRCLELLWGLVDLEDKRAPVFSNSAFKVLKELAKHHYRKPVSVQEEILDAIESWIEDEAVYGIISGPRFLDLLDQPLAKVVDEWHAEGHVARGRSYVVRMTDRDRDLRMRAIDAITRYGTSEHAGLRDALEAKESLINVLRPPQPLLGLHILEQDYETFEPEQLHALEALEQLRTHWQDPIFDVELVRSLRWHAQNASSEQVQERVSQIVRDIDPTFEMRLTQSLMYSIDRRNPQEDEVPPGYDKHSEDPEALRRRTAQEFIERYPDPEAGVEELSRQLSELEDVNPDGSIFRDSRPADPSRFLGRLASESPNYAASIAQQIVENPGGPLDSYIGVILQNAEQDGEIDTLTLATDALTNGGRQSCSIAGNPQIWHERAKKQEVDIWGQILQADDKTTRWRAIESLVYRLEASPEEKKSLALQARLGEDADLADKLFSLFTSSHGIGTDGVRDDELCTLIRKLEPVGRLDKPWIKDFLKAASRRVPQAVFDLLLSRLRREPAENYRKYRAVPAALLEEHVGFGESLEGLAESQEYRAMLRQVRDLMLEESRAYSVPDVFVAMSSGINQAGKEVLREWINDCSPDRLQAVLKLVETAPKTFVLENDDFIGRVLDVAHDMGEEHFEKAKSHLLWAPQSGSRTRGPHQPAAKDVRNQERGNELAEKHASRPRLGDFYAELSAQAKEKIEKDLKRDKEFEM